MLARLRFSPRKIAYRLLAVVAFLLVANLVAVYCKFVLKQDFGFTRAFNFDSETNIPSLYSALSILMSAVILFYIGNLKMTEDKSQARRWKLLAYIFLFLALDEFISIHESLTGITKQLIGDGNGYFTFAWVVPYALLFGVIFIYLAPFYFRLPVRMKIQFAIAGSIFLAGALGMEVVAGRYAFLHSTKEFTYALLVALEETLEMVGIIVFNYSLLKYYLKELANRQVHVDIEVVEDVPMNKIAGVKVPGFLH
jgi:hypothetical protein